MKEKRSHFAENSRKNEMYAIIIFYFKLIYIIIINIKINKN